ncbi:MAG TPA: hypothetical protein VJM11_13175, partial [Nevskiaceae bacterium]|nr:hypothetical protein [Nevskiaceae bacterium]
ATTMSELLTRGLSGAASRPLGVLCAAIVLVCLSGYLAAQWLAGQKFLAGAFPISALGALVLFALMIVSYTAIGGFRGSVYVDSLQAVIRVIGTAVALGAVFVMASREPALHERLAAAGPSFLQLAPSGALIGSIAFALGFGAAALGFNLGQPHLVSRYLAGADPQETRAAWWIYIGFVQFTWTSMTVFGVVLRGVMPDLAEPEAGLSIFFHERMGPILTGIIVADVFATISATSNSLLVAMAQALGRDVVPLLGRGLRLPEAVGCILLGAVTMGASLVLPGSVMSLALSSVSLMAASVAPAVLIRVVGWRHDARSLLVAVVAGFGCALAWRMAGLSDAFNESAPGIAGSLLAHYLVVRLSTRRPA